MKIFEIILEYIFKDFGILVMTLYFVVKDVFVWILAYIVFWIPFTSAFFMLFANREICSDGECITSGSLPFLQGYNTIAFGLYLTTFGTDFDLDVCLEFFPNELSNFIPKFSNRIPVTF